MSAAKFASAQESVLSYLNHQNRPYSAQDVFQNMGKDIGKTAVVKAMETLAAEGRIKEKVYGKQKVYVTDQSQFPDIDEAELKGMDDRIANLNDKVQALMEDNRRTESQIKTFDTELTTNKAKQNILDISKDIESMQWKLSELKEGQVLISKEEKDQLYANRSKFVKEWRKRKRISNDILNGILEGYPKTKKQLFEEVGIETDEECNVKVPEL